MPLSLPYVTVAEMKARMRSQLIGRATDAQLLAVLNSASSYCNGYLRSRFELPLEACGEDLKYHVTNLALYSLMRDVLGFMPEAGDTAGHYRMAFEDAVSWLKDVAADKATPDGMVGAAVAGPEFVGQASLSDDGTSFVVSTPVPRGWR